MAYYNYHAVAKRLIREGKLTAYSFVERYRGISPALLLFFDDLKHPVMPIREQHWEEYLSLLKPQKEASASNCLPADAEKK